MNEENQNLMIEEPISQNESLTLDIKDDEFLAVIDRKIKESEQYYDKIGLSKIRKQNMDFWIGNHFDESKFEDWQVPYKDNIIWQNTETRISIAAGRLPDIMVCPGSDSEQSKKLAEELNKSLNITIDNDQTKRLVKSGLRHNHINKIGVLKCRWDQNKGDEGDYLFELVDPKKVGFDHNATIPEDGFTTDNMEYIYEYIEEPLGITLSKFPSKRDELIKELGYINITSRRAISKIRYKEIWFTWYDTEGKTQEGVAWVYKDIVLGKMKNPYYDWKGKQKSDNLNGQPIIRDVYMNFFERPRKPYILFSHINTGKNPLDDTTPIEQAISLQRTINKRGRQITEIADNAVPKKAFAGVYITKEQASEISNDPNESIWLEGADDVNKAITTLQATPPNPILYQDMIGNRGQVDGKFATHAQTRGESTGGESGISKQITREGDLTISDDIVNIVINRVVYEMACWSIQMIKLMYDTPHYARNMGKDGEFVEIELTQDKIEDGIALHVKANTVDKGQRKADAIALMGQKAIDPLSLFEDLDVPNPKERTTRLLKFLNGANDAYATYMEEIGVENIPEETQTPEESGDGQAKAEQDIQAIISGQEVQPNLQPDEAYAGVFASFVSSGQFDQLQPEIQMKFRSYIQQLKQSLTQNITN
jgi:hypothetical protein